VLGAALRRAQEARGHKAPEDLALVLTAALTLLGLIIGFSFSMSVSRYDQRKNYEEAEANAIGTEYLRVGLLSSADTAQSRRLLRSYLEERIRYYRTHDRDRLREISERTSELQNQLWSIVQNAALAQPNALTGLATAGMNDVLNSQGYTQAAWWNRIPSAAWLLMALIALLCNLLLGYAASGRTWRGQLLFIMPLLVSIAFFLIADIDSPRGGVILVSAENLLSLSEQLSPSSTARH
jgi:hypothetical protein